MCDHTALDRHRQHLPTQTVKAAEARRDVASVDLVAKLDELEKLTRAALGWTAARQDARGFFAGVGRLLEILAFYREL